MNISALIPSFFLNQWSLIPGYLQDLIIITVQIVFVSVCVILAVAFTTYFERKVIGYMRGRLGPNRVGPKGLGQPFADVIKLLIKEVVIPSKSNRFLFVIAPLLSLIPALATWAVIPLTDGFVILNVAADKLVSLCSAKTNVFILLLPHFLICLLIDLQFRL